MDNNFYTEIGTKNIKKPSIVSVIVMSVLTVIFSCAAVVSLRFSAVVMLVAFVAASASLCYILRFFGNPAFLLLPFISVAAGTDLLIPSVICAAAVAVCGLLFAILLRLGIDSFSFFMVGSLAYTVIVGAVFAFALIKAFGSISGGLEWLVETITQIVSEVLQGYDEAMVSMLTSNADQYIVVLPSVLFAVGIFTMWLTKWSLSCMFSLTGMRGRMFTRITRAPKALAWIFIIISIFGMVFSFASEGLYYAVMNVRTVLMVIFMGEGVREFITAILNMRSNVKRVIVVVVVINLISFLAPILAMVAAYYGAYKILFRKNKIAGTPFDGQKGS